MFGIDCGLFQAMENGMEIGRPFDRVCPFLATSFREKTNENQFPAMGLVSSGTTDPTPPTVAHRQFNVKQIATSSAGPMETVDGHDPLRRDAQPNEN